MHFPRWTRFYCFSPLVLMLTSLITFHATRGDCLGILLPCPVEVSPIELRNADVQVEITSNFAKTHVAQDFFNPNPRQLEADYYFPLPRGANVTNFALYMNGKPVKGEMLEKQKARGIYEDIVRRMRDPGLLEWVDYDLFKVRVFPVPANGTQRIELEFAQPLEADQGLYKYVFPLHSPQRAKEGPKRVPDVQFTVTIRGEEEIRNVYSPSHAIDCDLKDPKAARIRLPASSLVGVPGDFVLYYTTSAKDVALSLLASRPEAEDGFFALMLSPKINYDESKIAPKDVTFIVDTSGSMLDDNKIEQAKKALVYCVSQLRQQDRFNIIRFSTEVEKFHGGLMDASKLAIEKARQWIGELQARGGTNISEALDQALQATSPADAPCSATGRIHTLVLLTDGMPTLGETNPDSILAQVKKHNTPGIRIFTFGVGNDVNAKLLDRLSNETRAAADYIRPGQDLEVPVSRFFDKIARPAMTNLQLQLSTAEAYDLYPKQLPDLFYGTQLSVFGRYKKSGSTAIRLTGLVAGSPAEFVYEKSLPEKQTGNEFVEKLWATRKIGYLLDEIRAHGENAELRDEVVRLSKKYGILTPYTSYLVAEDVPAATPPPPPIYDGWNRREPPRPLGSAAAPQARSFGQAAPAMEAAPGAPLAARRQAAPSLPEFQASTGSSAVDASKAVQSMKTAQSESQLGQETLRTAGGHTFRLEKGVWVDTQIQPQESSTLLIRYLSDAYFAALAKNPNLKEIFALGEQVRVKLPGGIVEVGPSGKEKLAPQDENLLQEQKK